MLCRLFAPPQKTCVKVGRQQRRCYRHGCARGREGGREGERETVYQELRGTSLARILALFQSGADALSITEPGTQTLGKQEEEEEEEEVWEEKKEEGGGAGGAGGKQDGGSADMPAGCQRIKMFLDPKLLQWFGQPVWLGEAALQGCTDRFRV